MNMTTHTTLGELIATFYQEFMDIYGDEEIAAASTALLVEKLLNGVYT